MVHECALQAAIIYCATIEKTLVNGVFQDMKEPTLAAKILFGVPILVRFSQ
jgi:hypothetical protein